MMNNNSITVAIVNEKKSPYREYNYKKITEKCKTSEIVLPFESHYQILIKNDNSSRIKLDIDIDGTIITGNGLLVNGNSQFYMERFIDTAKKLYFTKKSNEKVADPTNKENGFLTIKVSKEKYVPYVFSAPLNYTDPFVCFYDQTKPVPPPTWQPYRRLSSGDNFIGSFQTYSSDFNTLGTYSCTSNLNHSANVNFSSGSLTGTQSSFTYDTGATVEGDKSNQAFITTTWNGEEAGSDFIFQFKMLGEEIKLSPQDEKDIMEYRRLKSKFEGIK